MKTTKQFKVQPRKLSGSKAQSRRFALLKGPEFGVWNAEVLPPNHRKVKSEECRVRTESKDHSPRSTRESVRGAVYQKFFECAAFTLIELLIVIGIIVLLAGMLFTAMPAIQRVKTTSRLKNELAQVQTAIDAYKAKKGFYPPDNPGYPAVNQLYYELLGTRRTNENQNIVYYTLDGTARLPDNSLPSAFLTTNVTGFMNCTKGTGDDTMRGENFFKGGLRTGQSGNNGTIFALGSGIDGKFMIGKVNPWCYNSTNPTNNPGSYDLWIDYDFGGKSNRICNWSDRAIQLQP